MQSTGALHLPGKIGPRSLSVPLLSFLAVRFSLMDFAAFFRVGLLADFSDIVLPNGSNDATTRLQRAPDRHRSPPSGAHPFPNSDTTYRGRMCPRGGRGASVLEVMPAAAVSQPTWRNSGGPGVGGLDSGVLGPTTGVV